jgi:sterol 14alpha-demethylase
VLRSRKELQRLFSKVIQARRASGVQEADALQTFIDSKYRAVYGGRATNDEEITGFLIASLFAGQHTSSITSSWTGYFMINNEVGAEPSG